MNHKLEKLSVRLYAGDFARLGRKYPLARASKALRELLRKHLEKVDIEPQDLDISLELRSAENYDPSDEGNRE